MARRKTVEEPPLADYWKPPADNGLKGGVGEPVFCVATTFEFDASFFEAELLPRFLGLRFDHTENERTFIIEREESLATTHVGVLVDASKFDPRQTTLQWDQLPIQVPGGIQHAKVTVLVWERLVRLIVGSANLTRQGYRRNRELFAALDFFDAPISAPLSVLRDALAFIDTLCAWSRTLSAATAAYPRDDRADTGASAALVERSAGFKPEGETSGRPRCQPPHACVGFRAICVEAVDADVVTAPSRSVDCHDPLCGTAN